MPSLLPLPGTPFCERRGPGRGRLLALEEPLGGEGGWPRLLLGLAGGTTSAPRSRGGRDGRPQVTAAPTPVPGQRTDGEGWPGAAGPRGHSAGSSSHTHPGPLPREGRSRLPGRRGRQSRQLSLSWVGGWPSRRGAAGSAHPPPCIRRVPFSGPGGGERSGRWLRGTPGSPRTHALPERPRSREGRLAGLWPEMLPRGERTAGTRTRSAAGRGRAEGLSVSPALAVRGETPGARDRSDRARGVVLGDGESVAFCLWLQWDCGERLSWDPASSRLPRPLPRGAGGAAGPGQLPL